MIYFLYLLLFCITSILNFGYLIVFWRPTENIYNGRLLFWLGFSPMNLGILATVVETFLCLDRCLSIIFSIKYSPRYRIYWSWITIFGLLMSFGILLWINPMLSVIPESGPTTCTAFACFIITFYPTYTKFGFALINSVAGVTLYFLTRFTLNDESVKNRRITKTILIIIASTTFFELFPQLFGSDSSKTFYQCFDFLLW